MLSVMESNAEDEFAMLERAEAAPYLGWPATPWWYAPAVGLWVGALVGATWWAGEPALFIGAVAVLLVVEGIFLGWMQRCHGAFPFPLPGRGNPPREIALVWRGYGMGVAVIVLLVGLAWWQVGVPLAAAVAFVLVTGGVALHESRYARAAARARERLG